MKPAWDGAWSDDHVCSICGEDQGYTLSYVTVLMNPGEEGYAEVTMALCDDHSYEVAVRLQALGFQSHNHHGTNPLASDECEYPCPLEAEYGPELIQPAGMEREAVPCGSTLSKDGAFVCECEGHKNHLGLHANGEVLWR